MTWASNLPTAQQWDAQLVGATDSWGDTYATTFVDAQKAGMQLHAGGAGNLMLQTIRARLVAYHAVGRTNLPGRSASIALLETVLGQFFTEYERFNVNPVASTKMVNTARLALVRQLRATAAGKRAYLDAVHQTLAQQGRGANAIVAIVNRRFGFASPAQPHLLGLDKSYWIEKDHPLHATTQINRSLGTLWGEWEVQIRTAATRLPFFLWLEDVNYVVGNKTVAEPEMLVHYVLQADLAAYALRTNAGDGGRVVRSRSTADLTRVRYDTQGYHDGMATFVIAPPVGHAAPVVYSAEHERGLFHHSSFMAGEKVISAGMLRCTAGVITALSPKSGHYKPGLADFQLAIEIFRAQHLITPDTVIELDQFYRSLHIKRTLDRRTLEGLVGDAYTQEMLRLVNLPRIELTQAEWAEWADEASTAARASAVAFYHRAKAIHKASLTQAAAELALVRLKYRAVLERIKALAALTSSVSELEARAKLSAEWIAALARNGGFTEAVGMRIVRLVSRQAKRQAH